MKPLSNLMPSTNSVSCFNVLPSYTVMVPCSPTFSIKDAIKLPISVSPLAEIVATLAIYYFYLTGIDIPFNYLIISSTAMLIPLLNSVGFIPAATFLQPSLQIALVSTAAVVVPSPASSLVF